MDSKDNIDSKSSQNGGVNVDDRVVGEPANKKRKSKEVAIFGNYRHYYGYRVAQGMEEDPRLKLMKREWFEGKDCLDIGCNAGLITIDIAKRFCCRSILGVDIDSDRIADSYKNLNKTARMATCKNVDAKRIDGAEHQDLKNSGDLCYLQARHLLDTISFERGNFVHKWWPCSEKRYDTILCLSVTKWIHFNWGDDGLIALFVKIWKLLRPGGILILEPQSWESYSSNRVVSETAKTNYQSIKIFPQDFQYILLDKIGFRKVEDVTSTTVVSKSGFKRPILAFWK